MNSKDLKPFGVEFLEPIEIQEMQVRGGQHVNEPCCYTFVGSTDPDIPAVATCRESDSDQCV